MRGTGSSVRLLLCEAHRMVREGLRAALEQHGFEIVAEVADSREVVDRAHERRPDIVVLAVSAVALNEIRATQRLGIELPNVRVVGLAVHGNGLYADAMLAAGAVGYLPTGSGVDELVLALHMVASGHDYRGPSIGLRPSQPDAVGAPELEEEAPTSTSLSRRERQVLQQIAAGKSSKEMAASLGIGVATVETYRRKIMDKLGLRSIAGLTKYAVRSGLASLE